MDEALAGLSVMGLVVAGLAVVGLALGSPSCSVGLKVAGDSVAGFLLGTTVSGLAEVGGSVGPDDGVIVGVTLVGFVVVGVAVVGVSLGSPPATVEPTVVGFEVDGLTI